LHEPPAGLKSKNGRLLGSSSILKGKGGSGVRSRRTSKSISILKDNVNHWMVSTWGASADKGGKGYRSPKKEVFSRHDHVR